MTNTYYYLDPAIVDLAIARNCMSRPDLARAANIQPSTLFNAMNGHKIRQKTAGKIARALGVDVTEILKDNE